MKHSWTRKVWFIKEQKNAESFLLISAALKVLHKLMAYEIITMSSFHAAAMMGHHDIILALLDKVSSNSAKVMNNEMPNNITKNSQNSPKVNYFGLRENIYYN